MNVHARHRGLNCAQDVTIVERLQAVRQAALNATLGRAEFPRLHRLFSNLLRIEEVGVGFARATAESAEFAAYEADVCKVYVAIDDVRHNISGQLAAQKISCNQQPEQIVSV